MLKMSSLTLVLVASAAVSPGVAHAAATGFYVGAALGEANTHLSQSTLDIRDTEGAYKVFAGFRPIGLFGAEVNYVDFGRASQNGAHSDTTGVDVMGVAYLPIPLVDVYGKAGLVSWHQSTHSDLFSLRRNGTDFAYGAGVGVHFKALGVRLEYERFNVSGGSKLSLTSLGVSWSFL